MSLIATLKATGCRGSGGLQLLDGRRTRRALRCDLQNSARPEPLISYFGGLILEPQTRKKDTDPTGPGSDP